ncbi:MAG TPA: amino acid adenylation domain-containing protein, partial [Thermoanaerobaculia bacterium]|nr:amino acid adenylation domain-containing protein [Thermoanaerobaculia bacterium]
MNPPRTRVVRDHPEPMPVPEGAQPPLSHGQEALWFLDRLAPGNPAYVIAGAARIPTGFDSAALRRAFDALVERHPALRTTYGEGERGPFQQVHPAGAMPEGWFRVENSSTLDEDALRARLAEEAFRPFDLQRGPVLRVTLFGGGEQGDVLLVSVHHIAADLWSVGVLWNELGALYGREGTPLLPPLPLDATDVVRWQRRRMAGPEGERLWELWQERLAGAPLHLDLPADRPRPPVQSFRGGTRTLVLGPAGAGRVAALTRETGGTLFAVLLAAWSALLGRLSGQDDLLVGAPTPGRTSPELFGLVGYFVNPLVLRCELGGDPSFRELVRRARRTTVSAFRHQELPFPLLAERLAPERDPSRPPVFQTLLSLQQAPRGVPEGLAAFAMELDGVEIPLGDLTAVSLAFPRPGAQLDLALFAATLGSSLALSLEHNGDLWDAASAERILGCFRTLLLGAAADPDLPLSRLPLLDEAGRRQVLVEWGQPAPAPDSPDTCLHDLVFARAAAEPEATAVVSGDERLTYAELAERARSLARHLRAAGVEPETRVGVALPRKSELIVSILAVLEAGGAYGPLDPAYPPERVAFMLEDSGARVLVSDRPAPPRADIRVIPPWTDIVGDEGFVSARARPDNLAYLIYTSGSTGRPKGVAIQHRSAVTLLRWARGAFAREDLAGVLASTSICFDLSVFEIFLPLVEGGTVILADNALALPSLPAAPEVTLLNTVPSAARELVRDSRLPESVRVVNLAGESLPGELVRQLYDQPGVREVWNLYGPSEDTTYSTWAKIGRELPREPVIGRPVAGSRAYVLDAGLEPLPAGVPGELYLGGAGLARGYLGRPELTAERFVPDPYAGVLGEIGARLYRTGDLVRWLPDGTLDFLGRIDHQVKIRGFRIELGEIEAALSRHPQVGECAVLVREAAAGDRRLVAYLAPKDGAAPAPRELRGFLAMRLPDSMLPAAFVTLPALPLTPNGKVDRRALARLPFEAGVETGAGAAPRTPAEEVLAGIWCDLLGVPAVGVHDDFFAMGGHSLLATRMLGRARDAFGVSLPLAAALRHPTIAGLAALLEARRDGDPTPPVVPVSRKEPLPLSFAQERLWFLDQMDPGSPLYNVPAGLRLTGPLSVPVLAGALREIVRRHEVLRTTLPALAGGPVQRIAPSGDGPAVPVVDLSGLPGAVREPELARLGGEEARRPFDIARGPLFRVRLVRLGGEDHAALLTLHHTVCDGWSLGVLATEVAVLYPALLAGRPSPLPELPVQYGDFAVWQRRLLAGERLTRELAWWRERLAGVPRVLDLPTDRPRPAVRSDRGDVVPVSLPEELAAEVAALGRRSGATPFMVLLAALSALLGRFSRQEDLLVGSAGANRTRPEVEPLLGFFANTLPLRMDLAGEPDLAALLARARETTLAAYAHQDLPFERLVEELAPERALGRTPLVQVVFVLQDGGPAGWQRPAPGLELSPLVFHSGTAKFDLLIDLTQTPRGIAGTLELSRDLFDAATVRRMWESFRILLTAAVRRPEAPVADLPLLTEAESAQILEWNATVTDYPREATIGELFAAQARQTPDAVALAGGGLEVTYAELEARASRLAEHLREMGVTPEVAVGMGLERSVEAVEAQLAIYKAGGVYVPLDPSYPT